MPAKTNAIRILDQMGISYELREYDVDPNDLAAETVAAKVGMPAEQVFKTLVARGDRNGKTYPGNHRRGSCGSCQPQSAQGSRSRQFPA